MNMSRSGKGNERKSNHILSAKIRQEASVSMATNNGS
jgi:hypothetical protein